jgi:phosphopantetheine--protein transferase-like protein
MSMAVAVPNGYSEPWQNSLNSGRFTLSVRVGTDVVDTDRIRKLLRKYDRRFTRRFFGDAERYFAGNKPDDVNWYARFWAGREAVFKIFGSGNYWRDIRFQPHETGEFDVEFTGSSLHEETPIPRDAHWDVSTSLEANRALAVAACEWND